MFSIVRSGQQTDPFPRYRPYHWWWISCTGIIHSQFPMEERAWREEYFQQLVLDADYIQGISKYTVSRLVNHYPLCQERVFFTYLPIDQRLRYGSSRPGGKTLFIYPANFWTHKNHEILLIAYAALSPLRRLEIAGIWCSRVIWTKGQNN